jgi:hypothetical protein
MNIFGFIANDAIIGLFFSLLLGTMFGFVFGLIRYMIFSVVERKTA